MIYPGGGKRELEYDGLMRLTHLSATDPGGNSVLDYAYDYDSQGNIVSKSTEHGTYAYGYDGASRLTSADNPTLDDESYLYDAVGNRTSASNATGSISHNANNELTVYGELEYAYDANGNMTEVLLSGQVMFRYHYNADNRLVKVEGGNNNTLAEYSYDPFGRRLWKEVAGTRTYFFYSDEGLIAEYDASGNELKFYGYRPDSTWTTDPLFLRTNGHYYFYQSDHLGTPQKLVAQNGAVVWSATYSAFGEAMIDVETVENNLRFPGQYLDVETGLHYNFHRYYDPVTGRYVSTDPIGFEGGDVNFYNYALNNPIQYYDQYAMALSGVLEGVGGALVEILIGGLGVEHHSEIIVAIWGEQYLKQLTRVELRKAGGPLSVQFLDYAFDEVERKGKWCSGDPVLIDSSNQQDWNYAVDMIRNSSDFQKEAARIKQRLREGTDHSGITKILFSREDNPDLFFSMKRANVIYEYREQECTLKFEIRDRYDFDVPSPGKYFQDRGLLANFDIRIYLPDETFSIE